LNITEKNILKTLSYFDIFRYPISKAEIMTFHASESRTASIDEALENLCKNGLVFKLDEFYTLQYDHSLLERRRKGNSLANEQMKTAYKAAAILARFPYVKGLAISGSLSKNFAEEKTDIDFFIITAVNRLWIARTILHLFYKLNIFTGRQRWFCLNYYVDEAAQEIVEKNIFTAIEIATLLPMQGKATLANFMKANEWKNNYFPNCKNNTTATPIIKKGPFATLVERLCNGNVGNKLDNWLMHYTDKRWKKKVSQNRKNSKGIAIGMLVDKHYAKPNPGFFQDKIIGLYQAKIDKLEQLQPVLSRAN